MSRRPVFKRIRPPGYLTPRQSEVAHLIGQGLTNREIAARLSLSRGTVNSHVSAVLAALGVRNRQEVVRLAATAEVYGIAASELFSPGVAC